MRDHAVYFLACFYGGIVTVDNSIMRMVVLVLLAGLSLQAALPIKVVTSLALVSISTLVYAYQGKVDYHAAIFLSIGTILGCWIATRFADQPWAKVWVYRLMVVTVIMETIYLAYQYLQQAAPSKG